MDHSPAALAVSSWRLGLDCSCRRWRGAVDLEGTMEEAERTLEELHARHRRAMTRPEVVPGPLVPPLPARCEDA